MIQLAGMVEQGNVLPEELAIEFLSELDGLIQSDIMLMAPEEIVVYDNVEQELLLRPPHDKLYVHYLVMMIRQCQQEFEGYNNSQEIVNEKLAVFQTWYADRYRPAQTLTREYTGGTSAGLGPFAYLTAYGLAVKHGYRGTEEEWLESLKGAPGEAARMRFDADREMVQWGVRDTWYDLFALPELRDPMVEATIQAAQRAADKAQQEAERAGMSAQIAAASQEAAVQAAEAAATAAKGAAGIYIGGGEMPDGYAIQLDPDGDEAELSATQGWVTAQIRTAVTDAWEAVY